MREWYIEIDNWRATAYEPGTSHVDEKNAIHVIEIKEFSNLENEFNELKKISLAQAERLEIAEKYVAMSSEAIWDAYIEEIRGY